MKAKLKYLLLWRKSYPYPNNVVPFLYPQSMSISIMSWKWYTSVICKSFIHWNATRYQCRKYIRHPILKIYTHIILLAHICIVKVIIDASENLQTRDPKYQSHKAHNHHREPQYQNCHPILLYNLKNQNTTFTRLTRFHLLIIKINAYRHH